MKARFAEATGTTPETQLTVRKPRC
jgi:hypothetical protein